MGTFGRLFKIIPLKGLYAGFSKMLVPPAMKELALNSVTGAPPVNYVGAQIAFPPSHASAKGRYRIQPSVTFTENNMITPGHTNDVAILCFIHYLSRVSAGVRIIRFPTKTTMTPNSALTDH
jgi:hypothetical protein